MSWPNARTLNVQIDGQRYAIDPRRSHDLSIPLLFDGAQPRFFGAARASASVVSAGDFVGEVARGGSCNCATYTLTPHCNGTHTECIGHIVRDPIGVRDVAIEHLMPALLVSVTPQAASSTDERSDPAPLAADRLITRAALQAACSAPPEGPALIVRTLPNPADKRWCDYDAGETPPYFSAQAIEWLVERNVRHLVVDLPSIDRAADQGRLHGHRLFWGVETGVSAIAGAKRADATLTELAYIDAAIPDGRYLLNLQVAPFVTDAAPSRPVIFPLAP